MQYLLVISSATFSLAFCLSFTGLLVVQGTLRDLSKGGRNVSLDHMEPVC